MVSPRTAIVAAVPGASGSVDDAPVANDEIVRRRLRVTVSGPATSRHTRIQVQWSSSRVILPGLKNKTRPTYQTFPQFEVRLQSLFFAAHRQQLLLHHQTATDPPGAASRAGSRCRIQAGTGPVAFPSVRTRWHILSFRRSPRRTSCPLCARKRWSGTARATRPAIARQIGDSTRESEHVAPFHVERAVELATCVGGGRQRGGSRCRVRRGRRPNPADVPDRTATRSLLAMPPFAAEKYRVHEHLKQDGAAAVAVSQTIPLREDAAPASVPAAAFEQIGKDLVGELHPRRMLPRDELLVRDLRSFGNQPQRTQRPHLRQCLAGRGDVSRILRSIDLRQRHQPRGFVGVLMEAVGGIDRFGQLVERQIVGPERVRRSRPARRPTSIGSRAGGASARGRRTRT